jgi:hypothetical protein
MQIFAATHVALSCGVRPDCEWKCTLKGVGLLKYVNETLPLHRQHAARQRLARAARSVTEVTETETKPAFRLKPNLII